VLSIESDTVLHTIDDAGVLTLTLNRPERNNAWNEEMEAAFHSHLLQAAESPEVRAVVLTGAGRSFCPGVDSQNLARSAAGDRSPSGEGRLRLYLPTLIPKPVVCAINGGCAGFGLVNALMCDVRFANEEAKLSTAFSKRGLPAEEGISWILPKIVGHAVALELLISSRIVTGREAAALGMVHWAVPPDELLAAATEYARELASNCSPSSMAVIKRQVYGDWEETLADAQQAARRQIHRMRDEDDFREGVGSLLEKRPAHFGPHTQAVDTTDLAMEP
jgi:enoyl-CoA hydratase/carnithine racemase